MDTSLKLKLILIQQASFLELDVAFLSSYQVIPFGGYSNFYGENPGTLLFIVGPNQLYAQTC